MRNLGAFVAQEQNVSERAVLLMRHSSKQLKVIRSLGASIEEFTFVQPKDEPYDFLSDMGHGPARIAVVVEGDRVYAVYEVRAVIEEGDSAALHTPAMQEYTAANGTAAKLRRRFDMVERSSLAKGRRVLGWENSAIVSVLRSDNDLFKKIEVDIDREIPESANGLLLAMRFVREAVYVRQTDIHARYGGSRQNGISVSAKVPAIFIFTGGSGEEFGYSDRWEEEGDVFLYTGEGQVGDMRYSGGNRALRDHIADGYAVHLFESVPGPGGRYRYIDEMQCVGSQLTRGSDRNGEERSIIQFRMVRLGRVSAVPESEALVPESAPMSLQALRDRAYMVATTPVRTHGNSRREILDRSREVAQYALVRAEGRCESCLTAAPFLRTNGQPYLEVHHTTRLADAGLDAPAHVAAICPTCHRHIHYGRDGDKRNDALRTAIAHREAALDRNVGRPSLEP